MQKSGGYAMNTNRDLNYRLFVQKETGFARPAFHDEMSYYNYIKEGKNQLVIGIGCTGGKHRSVTLANEIYKALNDDDKEYGVTINHRDIGN